MRLSSYFDGPADLHTKMHTQMDEWSLVAKGKGVRIIVHECDDETVIWGAQFWNDSGITHGFSSVIANFAEEVIAQLNLPETGRASN